GPSGRLTGGARGPDRLVLSGGRRAGDRARGAGARAGVGGPGRRRSHSVLLSPVLGPAVAARARRGLARRGAARGGPRAAPPAAHRVRAVGLRRRTAVPGAVITLRPSLSRRPAASSG